MRTLFTVGAKIARTRTIFRSFRFNGMKYFGSKHDDKNTLRRIEFPVLYESAMQLSADRSHSGQRCDSIELPACLLRVITSPVSIEDDARTTRSSWVVASWYSSCCLKCRNGFRKPSTAPPLSAGVYYKGRPLLPALVVAHADLLQDDDLYGAFPFSHHLYLSCLDLRPNWRATATANSVPRLHRLCAGFFLALADCKIFRVGWYILPPASLTRSYRSAI